MNSAAAKVAEIEDVLSEILIRLPAKSLMKFKCVSKQWNLLISSPQFGLAHGQIHRALLLNRGFKGIDELQVVPLKFSLVPSSNFNFVRVGRLRILQSCNGLLLCRSIFQNRPISSQYNNYVMNGCIYSICNPATAQSKTLSFPASLVSKSRFSYLISVGLAFDPISSPYYKIVFILDLHKKDLETYLVAIYTYSSENDSWNSRIVDLIEMRLGNSLPHVLGIGFQEGVYCKNGIHWLRTSNHPSSLLCFGVDDWSMKKMELSMPMALNIRYFGECLGNLYIIAYNHPNFEVVEIAPDYCEWVVKYSVNLQPIIECSPGDWEFWILGIVHEKNEERVVVSCTGGKIMSCNLKDGMWEMIYELDGRQRLSYQGECYKYFESLIRI